MRGCIDAIKNNDIITEIKFAIPSETHILQCVLYHLCKYETINNEMKIEILNLYTGVVSVIQFNNVDSDGFIKKLELYLSEMTEPIEKEKN
jgi:hypothetical protein